MKIRFFSLVVGKYCLYISKNVFKTLITMVNEVWIEFLEDFEKKKK